MEYKFWDIIKTWWKTCRFISKDYDENWNYKDRIRLIDENENIFTTCIRHSS